MVKKLLTYIFIYMTLTSCDDDNIMGVCQSNCFLEVEAPNLIMDENGYYHMEFQDNYYQTFTTLKAVTGSVDNYQKLGWISDTEVNVGGSWTNCVNGDSYTDTDGNAYTVLSAWEILIGDTIRVYGGYHDGCDVHYVDSLKVVID